MVLVVFTRSRIGAPLELYYFTWDAPRGRSRLDTVCSCYSPTSKSHLGQKIHLSDL